MQHLMTSCTYHHSLLHCAGHHTQLLEPWLSLCTIVVTTKAVRVQLTLPKGVWHGWSSNGAAHAGTPIKLGSGRSRSGISRKVSLSEPSRPPRPAQESIAHDNASISLGRNDYTGPN